MVNTRVTLCGKELDNPIIPASGTFGYGREFAQFYDINCLGTFSIKGTTAYPRFGNAAPRIADAPAGMLNSIGLQNPGVKHFIEKELPEMKKHSPAVMANLGGSTVETYEEGARLLDASDVDFIELNISCPNVKAGGIAYGVKADSAREVVRRVRACTTKPLVVKMSPNAENIVDMALACEEAGADALSLVNTFQAMAIDIERRRPVFDNIFAGLSGPAIRPIALRMVYQVCKAVKVPVVGLGGIATAHDALEFIMAGATAVQVGTANFADPQACEKIARGMARWMDQHGVKSLDEIRGAAL